MSWFALNVLVQNQKKIIEGCDQERPPPLKDQKFDWRNTT